MVLMLVDGLGYDAISSEATPNLHAYAAKYTFRPMRPVLGYSDTQRAVLFTGQFPDRIGYWMQYRFSTPEKSPWRNLGALSILDALPIEFPRKVFKFGLSASLLKLQTRNSGYDDLNIHNIPFRVLPWFAPTLPKSAYAPRVFGKVPTIFDRMRESGRPFGIVRTDTVGKFALLASITRQMDRLRQKINDLRDDTSFVYFYIHTPDMFAHRFGIRGPKFWDELKTVDEAFPVLIDALKARFGAETQVVLVSDHGMNQTEEFVNYQHLVTHPSFGKDFVVALDSTTVRFRYLTPQGGKIARNLMEDSGKGYFVSRDELRELGVSFPGEYYGDDIYLLRPGISIYPNYHSLLKPLAMHAYHPDGADQQAIALFIGDDVSERAQPAENLSMNDIYPIVCASLGLDGV